MKRSWPADALHSAGDAVEDPPARTLPIDGLNKLAARAAAGDSAAVDRLATQLRPMLTRYSRARIGRAADGFEAADDVARKACVRVLAALPRYSGTDRPFNTFVYRIAAKTVADHYRSNATNRSIPVEYPPEHSDPGATPEKALVGNEPSGQLEPLLGVLGTREREIVTLRLMAGLSAEQPAQAVGSTQGAVRAAQHRALTKLRTALADPRAQAFG